VEINGQRRRTRVSALHVQVQISSQKERHLEGVKARSLLASSPPPDGHLVPS